jgi:NADPH:quinone reductase-like Zn-dependent oxidoreductase
MRILPNALARRPLPAEHDLSGVVVDANGTEFSPGDQVFGFISAGWYTLRLQFLFSSPSILGLAQATGQGALAQYARVPSDHLAIRPPNISPIEASGITLVGQTAYQALIHLGTLEAGQTILINGGSSAVGLLAIQIAKANGAIVFATASTKNEEFVRRQGADHVSPCPLPHLPPLLVYDSSSTILKALCMNTSRPILRPQNFI